MKNLPESAIQHRNRQEPAARIIDEREVARRSQITEFNLVSFTSNDTDVVATVHWMYTVNATGKTASMYMQHWFRFADGKIVFFRGSEDTDQSAHAFA